MLQSLISTVILACLLAVVWPYFQEKQYCYASVTTLSSSHNDSEQYNCFTVTSKGTFGRIFTSTNALPEKSGYVIPGLWDGHGHILQYGEFLDGVDLFGTQSLAEVNSRIREYIAKNPEVGTAQQWIRGVGWDQAALGGSMPAGKDLEDGERYIMLDRVDVHCIWVSQAVLRLLPHPLPPSPPGGEVITEPGPGVFCDNAMEMVLQHWPSPGKLRKQKFLKRAMSELNSLGLVGMHDAGVKPVDLDMYKEWSRTDEWTVRIYAMRECSARNTFCADQVDMVPSASTNGMLSVHSVKLFADGALGSWGSALLEPYTDRPWTSGSLLVNASTLEQLAVSWAAAGYQTNIHAIGDKANRLALDAQVSALRVVCPGISLDACQRQRRFRIEHSQIIHPDDQERIAAIGIIPSIQPTHATSDMAYAENRLGKWRTSHEAYRMRSFLPLQPVLGSDFPVEPPNPFQGMYAAVVRRSPRTGFGADGTNASWYPEESITLSQALEGFTKWPAHAAFLEKKAGVIQPEAFADWVVLDKPIDKIDIDDLRTLKVRETWVAGRRVYQRD